MCDTETVCEGIILDVSECSCENGEYGILIDSCAALAVGDLVDIVLQNGDEVLGLPVARFGTVTRDGNEIQFTFLTAPCGQICEGGGAQGWRLPAGNPDCVNTDPTATPCS